MLGLSRAAVGPGRGPGTRPEARRFAAKLMVAFLPAAMVGALADHAITTRLFSPRVVAVSLIVGGVAIC